MFLFFSTPLTSSYPIKHDPAISIMLETINRLFLAFLLVIALLGIVLSIGTLLLPGLLGAGLDLKELQSADHSPAFQLLQGAIPASVSPDASPYEINLTINTPYLEKDDELKLHVFSEGRDLKDTDCLESFDSYDNYSTSGSFTCTAVIPYGYISSQDYEIYASLSGEGKEYASGPIQIHADWSTYESNFWGFSTILAILIGAVYLFILLPLSFIVLGMASHLKHANSVEGEYSLRSLLNPFAVGKTLMDKINSFIISPYFWAIESIGILIIIFYLAIFAGIWKSGTALSAFLFSGLLAFIIPFLWVLAWWYADYREREPLRIIITFFLWGMLAALMAIGFNTLTGVIFEVIGLGFLSSFLLAPPTEEFFKGSGICLLSEHHEFDSIEDGLVYGFVIGMGFSFIEDWLYMLNNPMGSDIWSWLGLFFLRSILFSSNHGLYTAITGGVIGFLIERRFKAPALGLLIGVPIAAFFHAMHNSGEMLGTLLGGGGLLVYCCLLIPFFDYGGLIFLVLFFIYALLRKRPKKQ